nr:hypothetical protein [Acidihalobacter prosperus]
MVLEHIIHEPVAMTFAFESIFVDWPEVVFAVCVAVPASAERGAQGVLDRHDESSPRSQPVVHRSHDSGIVAHVVQRQAADHKVVASGWDFEVLDRGMHVIDANANGALPCHLEHPLRNIDTLYGRRATAACQSTEIAEAATEVERAAPAHVGQQVEYGGFLERAVESGIAVPQRLVSGEESRVVIDVLFHGYVIPGDGQGRRSRAPVRRTWRAGRWMVLVAPFRTTAGIECQD